MKVKLSILNVTKVKGRKLIILVYLKKESISKEKTLAAGMAEKAKEFVATGAEIYHGNMSENITREH